MRSPPQPTSSNLPPHFQETLLDQRLQQTLQRRRRRNRPHEEPNQQSDELEKMIYGVNSSNYNDHTRDNHHIQYVWAKADTNKQAPCLQHENKLVSYTKRGIQNEIQYCYDANTELEYQTSLNDPYYNYNHRERVTRERDCIEDREIRGEKIVQNRSSVRSDNWTNYEFESRDECLKSPLKLRTRDNGETKPSIGQIRGQLCKLTQGISRNKIRYSAIPSIISKKKKRGCLALSQNDKQGCCSKNEINGSQNYHTTSDAVTRVRASYKTDYFDIGDDQNHGLESKRKRKQTLDGFREDVSFLEYFQSTLLDTLKSLQLQVAGSNFMSKCGLICIDKDDGDNYEYYDHDEKNNHIEKRPAQNATRARKGNKNKNNNDDNGDTRTSTLDTEGIGFGSRDAGKSLLFLFVSLTAIHIVVHVIYF